MEVQNLPGNIRGNASHVVVVAGAYRAEFLLGIEVYIFFEKARYLGNLFFMDLCRQVPQIDPDMLDPVIGVQNTSALEYLRFDCPCYEIPRGQLLHLRGIMFHEGFEILVAKDAAH